MTECNAAARKKGFFMNGIWLVCMLALLTGCAPFGRSDTPQKNDDNSAPAQKMVRYEGEMSKEVSLVYTTKRQLALTFNGMGDKETMLKLLDELDRYHIQATFFLPGMRVAEEPDIARTILSRGHEIENNTLSRVDLTRLSYEKLYSEIELANQVIKKETGVVPRYVRTKLGDYNDDIRLATAQNGQAAVISYSLFLHNWQKETDEEKRHYLRKYINRGGIIAIDTEENKQLVGDIPLIAEAAADVGYKFVSLHQLIEQGGERKPLEAIPGYDAAKINAKMDDAAYRLIYRKETNKKEVALSFDDWGTDAAVTKILDILEQKGVKASFFLRADGVERNPNLARAIAEGGHDVGNHTYSHPVNTKITPEQLQEEIVKAHRVITEAIQEKPTMYFRPPTGEFDERTLRAVSATGYHTVAIYDVTPSDFVKSNSADDIVAAIMEQTKNGSVILLHLLDDIHTVEALPTVIDKLRSKGYTFVRMTDMFG
ncbi:polysaccharide deacetylase family protein [Brevibacillus reuszeri]|uniref:polysaccharide deacetylase family protein n=1 Tax=Brevibacillus reuszeri TaxID=54915 RepID=UPI00289D66BE|nr:polysaccharide deacetylase family protein [Brevibacillus reuszeri]